MGKNILIGGAWPYANSDLHLGHIAGLISGDILARYFRLKGDNVMFVSGTDCHGTPITERAKKENKSPKEIAEYYHKRDKETLEKYDFAIYTFAGDVTIIKDGKEYDFKQALENKIITIDEILQQGKLDAKYGICEEAYYKDGGSIEYQYPKYTVLKYHSLDGNGDFVIGSTGAAGQIINEVSEVLYK